MTTFNAIAFGAIILFGISQGIMFHDWAYAGQLFLIGLVALFLLDFIVAYMVSP